MTELKDYEPVAEERKLVVLPNIPEREYALAWARAYNAEVQERFNGNSNLIQSEDFSGMNLPKALLADEIANREYEGRVRVALPKDLDDRVIAMTKDKFYTIPRALIFRDTKDIWEKNKPIADELAGHIEQANGKIPKYAMITGMKVEPWPEDRKGYGLKVVPVNGEFRVVESDFLSREFNEWYFSKTNKDGLPEDLTIEKGEKSRRWFTSDSRLSGFGLDSGSSLGSSDGDLADSYRFGRVVFVRGEATRAGK